MISLKPSILLLACMLLFSLSLSAKPAASAYSRLYSAARDCYESGRNEACDSLLAELMSLRLKRLQRRKVSSLLLDNAFVTDRREVLRQALDSRYVRRSLDRTDYRYWSLLSELPATEAVWPEDRVTVPFRRVRNALYGIDVSVTVDKVVQTENPGVFWTKGPYYQGLSRISQGFLEDLPPFCRPQPCKGLILAYFSSRSFSP